MHGTSDVCTEVHVRVRGVCVRLPQAYARSDPRWDWLVWFLSWPCRANLVARMTTSTHMNTEMYRAKKGQALAVVLSKSIARVQTAQVPATEEKKKGKPHDAASSGRPCGGQSAAIAFRERTREKQHTRISICGVDAADYPIRPCLFSWSVLL